MALIVILALLIAAAVLTPRLTPEDREHRGLSFPPEWPRLPELPPTAYGASPSSPAAAVPLPRPRREPAERDLVA